MSRDVNVESLGKHLNSAWVDSIMLAEEEFSVSGLDASDTMLKYTLKEK